MTFNASSQYDSSTTRPVLKNNIDVLNHCGPIAYPEMTPVMDEKGIRVKDPVPVLSEPRPKHWQAQWIWLDNKHFPQYQNSRPTCFCSNDNYQYAVAAFRKTVHLDSQPKKVHVCVTADSKYRLYVNGQMVARGPAEMGGDYDNKLAPNWWFYDVYDLTANFQPGKNVITAEVVLGPTVQADHSIGHGGFLFEANLGFADGKEMTIKSDDSWRAIRNEAWQSPYQYDSRQDPGQWHEANFDDSQWPQVQVLENRWNLLPREIPPLLEARVLPIEVIFPGGRFSERVGNVSGLTADGPDPVIVTPGCPVVFWLRFERELTGRSQLCVRGAAGTVIELNFQETFGVQGRNEQFTLRDGMQWIEGIELCGVEYLQVTIRFPGGNYCQTPVEIFNLAINFSSFPVAYRGDFSCSDEILNQIWKVGRWTNQFCMQGYHMDSPIHQEGLGCTGDYMIEALISYYVFGEARLARQDILRTAYLLEQKDYKMFHTSYSLLWVQMIRDYWFHTGDVETVRAVLPTVHGLISRFNGYIGKTGLVTEAPDYMFMDWGIGNGFEMHHPPCVIGQGYMSAFYFRALNNAAELCSICGDGKQTDYETRAAKVKDAFNRELWVEQKQLYCDGKPFVTQVPPSPNGFWLPADVDQIFFSQHTNALAVAYELAPEERRTEIMERVLNDSTLPLVQPYFMHFVFEAIERAGLFGTYGASQMRRWKMLIDEHPTGMKECWNNGDYSHAWGATPTYQMPARVLGAWPTQAGWESAMIRPCPGDLAWAKGSVPTPKGELGISWERENGKFDLRVTIPEGMATVVEIPKMNLQTLTIKEDGKPANDSYSVQDESFRIKIHGGSYCFELR
jgi:hypothetical protein